MEQSKQTERSEESLERDETEPGEGGGRETIGTIVIQRSRPELYAFWRDFTNLPRFVDRVKSVTEVDALSSLWSVLDADGQATEWEVMVTDDERDRLIAWTTSGRTPAHHTGRVEFEDASTGTRVTAVIREAGRAGVLEHLLSAVSGAPSILPMRPDLARLKALMEAGEPVQLPGSSAQGAAAAERGIGIIAPERSDSARVSDDLQGNQVAAAGIAAQREPTS
jgi:uncharacterized membrane protein